MSMKKIKVLQLITGLGMGGAEKAVLELSKFLNKNYFENHVISLGKRIDLVEDFKSKNINITVLNQENSIVFFLTMLKKVHRYVRANDISIIHAHMIHPLIIASLIKFINPKLKIIYTSHSANIGSKVREYLAWILLSFRDVDVIFSKELLRYYNKKNYRIIPNGINISKYDLSLKKNDVFTITTIGRLEYVKNHTFLLDLAHNIKPIFKFKIQIVGAGKLEYELKKKVKALRLENQVCFLGLRNDIPQILNRSHCFILPSHWEGLPLVLLEAGASRVPILSTAVGSIPSFINDTTGYLFDLKDFKEAIINIYNNYPIAIYKADALFLKVQQRYSIESVVQSHQELYISLHS